MWRALVGIPLGYVMGLTNLARGWFDPIVELMRRAPSLALIPLMIILLLLIAFWIMTIGTRSGACMAMAVFWGIMVAAELVVAERGLGVLIMVASKFQLTDIVIVGIKLIDAAVRFLERWLVLWKGKV